MIHEILLLLDGWQECERPGWIRPGRPNFMDWFFFGANTSVGGRTFDYIIVGRFGEDPRFGYIVKCYRKLRSGKLRR